MLLCHDPAQKAGRVARVQLRITAHSSGYCSIFSRQKSRDKSLLKMAAAAAVDAPGIDKAVFAEVHRWCREGKLDHVRDFLHFGEGVLNYFSVKTNRGTTLLHEAVEADQADVIQLILFHGIPPDVRGKNNQTPLHLAAAKGHVLCVQALLEGGADMTLVDDLGHTVLTKAERSKKRDPVLRLLRSKGMLYVYIIYVVYCMCKYGIGLMLILSC